MYLSLCVYCINDENKCIIVYFVCVCVCVDLKSNVIHTQFLSLFCIEWINNTTQRQYSSRYFVWSDEVECWTTEAKMDPAFPTYEPTNERTNKQTNERQCNVMMMGFCQDTHNSYTYDDCGYIRHTTRKTHHSFKMVNFNQAKYVYCLNA